MIALIYCLFILLALCFLPSIFNLYQTNLALLELRVIHIKLLFIINSRYLLSRVALPCTKTILRRTGAQHCVWLFTLPHITLTFQALLIAGNLCWQRTCFLSTPFTLANLSSDFNHRPKFLSSVLLLSATVKCAISVPTEYFSVLSVCSAAFAFSCFTSR